MIAVGAVCAAALMAAVVFLAAGPLGALLSPKVTVYADRDLTVASTMDQLARTKERVARGDPLHGHWVSGPGAQARWLKVALNDGTAGYVWGRDLADHPPPDVGPTPQHQFATANVKSLVYAQPDKESRVVDALGDGESTAEVGAPVNGSWAEIALPQGGVGYVPSAVFGGGDIGNASPAPADASELASLKHYTCTLADRDDADAPSQISLYLDESRNCINHRYVYTADDSGNLERVLLNDAGKTAAVLTFSADRASFTRADYRIDHAAYARLKRNATTLDSLTCAAPADDKAQETLETLARKVTPRLDGETGGTVTRRLTWQCLQAH